MHRWRPYRVGAVRRRHVVWHSGEAAVHGAHGEAGHKLVGREAFQQIASDAHVDLRANEPLQDALGVALELDVLVDVDFDGHPALDGVTRRQQRSQAWQVQRLHGASSPAAW